MELVRRFEFFRKQSFVNWIGVRRQVSDRDYTALSDGPLQLIIQTDPVPETSFEKTQVDIKFPK
jgi:hypothetical protein